jgi:hypothetical protein
MGHLRDRHPGADGEYTCLRVASRSHLLTDRDIQVWRNNINHGGLVAMNDNYTWAFGQVLAVVMLAAALNEIVHFLLGQVNVKRKRRAQPRAIQAEEVADAAS